MSSPSAAPTDQRTPESPSHGEDEPRAVDITHRDGPPPELLEQMARADEINARLRGRGLQVSFALSRDGRSVQIELRDDHGKLLRHLSLTEAIELAEGGGEGE